MSKRLDLSKLGGFPFTQDQLDYLQQAFNEKDDAILQMAGDGTIPFIVNGAVITRTNTGGTLYDFDITDGWIYYNGELIRVAATTITGLDEAVDNMYLRINANNSTLPFNDGSSPTVVLDNYCDITNYTIATPNDATKFLWTDLSTFAIQFGIKNRDSAFKTIVVNTLAAVGGVTGTIYYKKDYLANTLHIKANLIANDAQNFAASPLSLFSLMGTMPAGYIPAANTYFIANYFVASLIKDDLGVGWVKQVNCGINTGGQILVNWIRPDAAILAYGINFNTIIPLD